jgi:hypothetical protein
MAHADHRRLTASTTCRCPGKTRHCCDDRPVPARAIRCGIPPPIPSASAGPPAGNTLRCVVGLLSRMWCLWMSARFPQPRGAAPGPRSRPGNPMRQANSTVRLAFGTHH